MASFLEKLRNRKKPERRAFALFVSVLITAVIFIVWLLSFVATLDTRFSTKEDGPLEKIFNEIDSQDKFPTPETYEQDQLLEAINSGDFISEDSSNNASIDENSGFDINWSNPDDVN